MNSIIHSLPRDPTTKEAVQAPSPPYTTIYYLLSIIIYPSYSSFLISIFGKGRRMNLGKEALSIREIIKKARQDQKDGEEDIGYGPGILKMYNCSSFHNIIELEYSIIRYFLSIISSIR